ncbi:MAG: orotidine-5'-phosphate decarboxylase [Candidatus Omnitrophica bacterium]|nr:orotidine-5'-phosphate decarboxylase [Candidatus Omnitrophota bacterium]
MNKTPQLIVALDVDSLGQVRELVEKLEDVVDIFKVGSQLFTACGPAAVRFIQARGKKVFLDLKYHDIPNTVASAVKSATGLGEAVERNADKEKNKEKVQSSLFMYTVHTCGGVEMMKAAVLAGTQVAENIGVKLPLAVGVTVLTSEQKQDNILPLVLERAALAKEAGLQGVVASCHEARHIREKFGPDFVIVTPGIRPAGADVQDQKRVATPKEAMESGSNFLVVGRPIVQAEDPHKAAQQILKELQSS